MSATRNAPTPLTPEEVLAYVAEVSQDLVKRRNEILDGAARFHEKYPEIPDDDVQGRAADFAGGKGAMAAFMKVAEGRRVEQKQPFDRAGAAVQGWFKGLIEPIEKAQKDIRATMTRYADKVEAERREKARAEAEKAAAAAREAEAKAMAAMTAEAIENAEALAKIAERADAKAEAPAAALTRVTGTLGTTASVRTRHVFNEADSDLMALVKAVAAGREPLHYLMFNTVRIGTAIRSDGVRQITGCQIDEQRSVV